MSLAPSRARNAVALPTSSMLTRLRDGAFDCALSISSSNSGIPDAARVERTGRDRVNTYALRAQFRGNVANGCFKRRLRYAHHIVILDHHLAAVIGHGEHGSAIL